MSGDTRPNEGQRASRKKKDRRKSVKDEQPKTFRRDWRIDTPERSNRSVWIGLRFDTASQAKRLQLVFRGQVSLAAGLGLPSLARRPGKSHPTRLRASHHPHSGSAGILWHAPADRCGVDDWGVAQMATRSLQPRGCQASATPGGSSPLAAGSWLDESR